MRTAGKTGAEIEPFTKPTNRGKPCGEPILVLGLVAGSLVAPAAAKKKKPKKVERALEVRYDQPAVGSPGVGGVTVQPSITSGVSEVYIAVEQTDDVSPLPFVRLAWDTDGDGTNDTGFTVCGGKTEEPMPIPGGTEISVFPYIAPGPQCATGFNTTGKIVFTFSNLP
ncbi:MAG: hypothetical protein ACRDJI_07660 [Actinomycetota bacterium]